MEVPVVVRLVVTSYEAFIYLPITNLTTTGTSIPVYHQCTRIRGARDPFQYQHRFQHPPLVGRVRGPPEALTQKDPSLDGAWVNQFDGP